MSARWCLMLMWLALAGCSRNDDRTTIVIQRFFGECEAQFGNSTDVKSADTECGILTTLLNKFQSENSDINVHVNVVAWPGYPQLSAQIAAGDPPPTRTDSPSTASSISTSA